MTDLQQIDKVLFTEEHRVQDQLYLGDYVMWFAVNIAIGSVLGTIIAFGILAM